LRKWKTATLSSLLPLALRAEEVKVAPSDDGDDDSDSSSDDDDTE
jgi:hypothetical protein